MREDDSIILSNKHGVNPSIEVCDICGEEMGLILFGKLKGDKEAPMKVSMGYHCDRCAKVIDEGGVFIIEVRDGERGPEPYRTGRLVAIKKEAADRMFDKHGPINYMEQTAFNKVFGEIKFE